MKKSFLAIMLSLVLVLALGLTACGKPGTGNGGGGEELDLTGTYDLTIWMSEYTLENGRSVQALTQEQIDAFEAANPGIVINATVEKQTEADSATLVIADVESAPDLFAFAQDQLARLVQAGALNQLGVAASEEVRTTHDASAIGAATVAGGIYCYPLTSDNGYFMYYDKSVIQESSLDDLTALINDCREAEMNFSMEIANSAWYNAAWFFATGCNSEWTIDENGEICGVVDTFNSDEGVIALKGMQELLKFEGHVESSKTADFGAAIPSAIVVSGTWDSGTAKSLLGDNYGVADLPSFTVDGKSYHLGSFSGNKLLGVKPQQDPKRAAVCQKLALWLTGETCQTQRFEEFGWGPSNLAAQATEAVQSDPALCALAEQSAYAKPQCQIHGQWWDIAKTYATAAKAADLHDEVALRAALETYYKAINGIFSVSDEDAKKFGVVGGFGTNNWGGNALEPTDIPMTQKPEGTYISDRAIEVKAGDELKVRQGKGWDVAYGNGQGENGQPGKNEGNFVCQEAGWFFVKLVVVDGVGTVSLVKTNPNIGYGVVGSFGTCNWTNDTMMEVTSFVNGSSWEAVIEFKDGDAWKIRQGFAWGDNEFGRDGVRKGADITVKADGTGDMLPGTYKITLVLDVANRATITWELIG